MNRLIRRALRGLLLALPLLTSLVAEAALLSANAQPPQQQLQGGQDSNLAVTWRLTSTSSHSGGVFSPSAQVLDASSGALLSTLGGALSQPGSGPFLLGEFIQLPAASVQQWQRSGIRRLLLVRDFVDQAGGSGVRGQQTLLLPSAELRAVSVQPAQRQLQAEQDNSLMLAWQVLATGDYQGRVDSPQAQLLDPASGAALATLGGALSAEGNAPFLMSEQLELPLALLRDLQARGLRRVVLQREFSDGGPRLRAQVVLSVPGIELRAVMVQPPQRQFLATQDNSLALTWQVSGRGDVSATVSSRQASLVNPLNGVVLATLGEPLSASGRLPLQFSERLELPAGLLQGWLASGIQRVLVQREFAAEGTPLRGQMVVNLLSSGLRAPRENRSGELQVQRLSLSFQDGQRISLVQPASSLTAQVLLGYSGNGLLEGRWQVAEPGGSEGQPFYRTLTLVRQFLNQAQQSTLVSPPLPTDKAGKYRLRFCVGNAGQPAEDELVLDFGCPNEDLSVETVYEVLGSAEADARRLIGADPQGGTVTARTPFQWRAVEGAVVYRLQLFASESPQAGETEALDQSPRFVAGMLLPAHLNQTNLSDLLRSKLVAGRYYLWRVTAHDQSGALIGRSLERRVRYQP
ncbi:MAG: hypothetical protein ABWY06_17635 [Pseudomonas sp.]|uniref:hypothetical protein n=1 Tax=Pseudomonas sp. TaxID=306 RepID=UPI003395551A